MGTYAAFLAPTKEAPESPANFVRFLANFSQNPKNAKTIGN